METALQLTGKSARLEALFGFGARVAAAESEAHVLELMVGEGALLAGAAGAVVGIADGNLVRLAAAEGYPPGYLHRWSTFPLEDGYPMSDAIASRAAVYCSSRAERDRRWPMFQRTGPTRSEAFVVLPLAGSRDLLGAFTLSFREEREFEPEERSFLEALATQCALALERARSSDLEQQLRRELEFVAEASKVLARSLDLDATLSAAGRLVVPRLADWFVCDLVRGDTVELAALVHADLEKVALARSRRAHNPVTIDAATDLAKVLRSGSAALVEEVAEPMFEQLGLGSAMIAPLVVRDRTIGALSFASAESGRRYDGVTLALAEELAARVAVAVDNARLFEAQSSAYQSERVSRERTQRLQRFTERLAPALTVDAVAEIAVDKALIASRGTTAFLALAVEDGSGVEIRRIDGRVAGDMGKVTFFAHDHPSVIGEVCRTSKPLWLRNRTEWERFPPALGQPSFLRSAAIVPVLLSGRFLGILGIAFDLEREFPEDDRAFLTAIANQTAQAIDRARLHEEQKHIAQVLQESLLPRGLPAISGVELAASYQAAGRSNDVGGDFYDAFEAGDGHVIVIGDVCGKGAEAAALTALCRYTLRAHTSERADVSPAELLGFLNEDVLRHGPGADRFATIVCVRLAVADGRVSIGVASAGHPPALVRRRNGTLEACGPTGPVAGIFPGVAYGERALELEPGDLLFLYTDGLIDGRLPSGGRIGEDAVLEWLSGLEPGTGATAVAASAAELVEGLEITDDVAIVCLSLSPSD